MTLTEAMYCMESYYKDDSPCELCPYYRSEKVVIDGREFYKCKEQEAHELVFKYIAAAERSKNTKVISLSPTSSSKVYDNYTDKFVENTIRTTQGGV